MRRIPLRYLQENSITAMDIYTLVDCKTNFKN